MTQTSFLDKLSEVKLPNVFNPYTDTCSEFDLPNAPAIRRNNLKQVMDRACERRVDVLWVARDLGYRGGRRTGLALTDEAHLDDHARLFGEISLRRATKGPLFAERTASIVWKLLNEMQRPVFLWNIFPFHPYEAGDESSNRCHTAKEASACRIFLETVVTYLQPTTIVGIGNEAQKALDGFAIAHIKVRHPSYGGQAEFCATIRDTFGLHKEENIADRCQRELFH